MAKRGARKETDFIASSMRIKAMEPKMLGREKLEKMLEAKTPADALAVLAECRYTSPEELESPYEYEKLLTHELEAAYALAEQISPDPLLVRAARLPYDYQNLKAVLKASMAGTDPEGMLVGTGNWKKEDIQKAASGKAPLGAERLAATAREALGEAQRTGDPQLIDLVCDRACFAALAEEADAAGYRYLREQVRARADAANILAAFRLRAMGKPKEALREVFVPGGSLDGAWCAALMDQTFQEAAERLARTPYRTLSDALAALPDGDLAGLARAGDEMLFQFVRDTRYKPYGPQVLTAFLTAKENEVKNARIVMAGKLAGAAPDVLRGRLRLF